MRMRKNEKQNAGSVSGMVEKFQVFTPHPHPPTQSAFAGFSRVAFIGSTKPISTAPTPSN
jgi:hypothetical protein